MKADDLLDDRNLQERLPLSMKRGSSGPLTVALGDWTKTVFGAERRLQPGCLLFLGGVYAAFELVSSFYYGYPLFWASIFGGITYITIVGIVFSNLKDHGWHTYEVYPDRIVRRSKYGDELTFRFHEIIATKTRHYGTILTRRRAPGNWLLREGNRRIMVLPRNLTSYRAVVEHVTDRVKINAAS